MKRNRLELVTIKKELWKYRGKENKSKEKPRKRGENEKLREKMEMIIEMNEAIPCPLPHRYLSKTFSRPKYHIFYSNHLQGHPKKTLVHSFYICRKSRFAVRP